MIQVSVTCDTLVSKRYIWWGMARHGFLWFCSCHTSDSVVCMHAKPSQATPRDTADSRPHTTCGAASELCHSSDRVYGPLPLTTHSALWHTWDNFETSLQRERIQMASLLQLSSPNAILSPCAFILTLLIQTWRREILFSPNADVWELEVGAWKEMHLVHC